MEKYHQSVQGICLLNKLYLEPEIIKKIRYYCNFSVDITGYRNCDLVRYLTKDNKERYDLKNTKHRRELIRMLYDKKIHIPPNRDRLENRFDSIVNVLVSSYKIKEHQNLRKNSIHFTPAYLSTIHFKRRDYDEGMWFRYYNYEIIFEKIQISKIKLRVTAHYHTYSVSTFVNYNIDDFLFLVIHAIEPFYIFKCMPYQILNDYIKLALNSNITNEQRLNEICMFDCVNEAFEYIDHCLLKYGKITYHST